MIRNKLTFSALVAACLSLGSAFAQDKAALTDEQKAKLEEIKAKFEALRAEHQGACDSLADARKEGARHRLGGHRNDGGPLSEERKALREDIKALVEEFKAKMAADGADKEALAAELREKIDALAGDFRAEHKAALDSLKAGRKADFEARKDEWEKRLADGKTRFEGRGGKAPLTPEQIEELKKRLEEVRPE